MKQREQVSVKSVFIYHKVLYFLGVDNIDTYLPNCLYGTYIIIISHLLILINGDIKVKVNAILDTQTYFFISADPRFPKTDTF